MMPSLLNFPPGSTAGIRALQGGNIEFLHLQELQLYTLMMGLKPPQNILMPSKGMESGP